MKNSPSLILVISIIASGIAAQAVDFDTPLYLWTEAVSSKELDQFTQERNSITEQTLQKNTDFKKVQAYFKNRIVQYQELTKTKARILGNFAYSHYIDDKHPQGFYRRVDKSLYAKAKESGNFSNLKWETIFDLDKAITSIKFPREVSAPARSTNNSCDYDHEIKEKTRCLIGFSQSGGDRTVYYEFDMIKKIWVTQDSFNFEILGVSQFEWLDQNTIVVSLDGQAYYNAQNPSTPITKEQAIKLGLLTASGYPSQFYIWKRGEKFSKKNLIYSASSDKTSVHFNGNIKLSKDFSPEKILKVSEYTDVNNKLILLHDLQGTSHYSKAPVNLPEVHEIIGITDNSEIIFKTKMDWLGFKNEDILSIQFKIDSNTLTFSEPKLVYRLEDKSAILRSASLSTNEEFEPSDDKIFITLSKNVSESIVILNRQGDSWSAQQFKDPLNLKYKTLSIWVDNNDQTLHLSEQSFLNPSTEYLVTSENNEFKFKVIDKAISEFNESKFSVEQLWINQGFDQNGNSIRVPYYIVFDPRKIKLDGNIVPAPTLMYGYGGFSNGMMPSYMGSEGHVWLEKGGVYVLTNIRGGNEFGTYWHDSALKENRKNSYNDFIGIAEDLIRRGITSPEKLSIQGGSNGGLLVGVAMTMRPDLFKAVICEVPLLDMSQYHKLSMGSSWMDEYGNPETTEKEFWKRYSPLHQLKKDVNYPTVFIKTNRNDDRVHPAHARKFSLRLEELGVQHLYYEDLKGGHGGTPMTSDESAFRATMDYIFLYDQLGMKF